MSESPSQLALEPIDRPSVADQVFDSLHAQILNLSLAPGARLSEVEVAKALGTSRQPVRDAFYRLSKLGFLEIRPQRATRVSLISTEAVLEARFVRTALEIEIIRTACETIDDAGLAWLRRNLEQQAEAANRDDRQTFHRLDDAFHKEICRISGHPFAWLMISEAKAHLDRVRLLSLAFNQHRTLNEHRGLYDALRDRDPELAATRMRGHLSRLIEEIDRIRGDNEDYFAEPADT